MRGYLKNVFITFIFQQKKPCLARAEIQRFKKKKKLQKHFYNFAIFTIARKCRRFPAKAMSLHEWCATTAPFGQKGFYCVLCGKQQQHEIMK